MKVDGVVAAVQGFTVDEAQLVIAACQARMSEVREAARSAFSERVQALAVEEFGADAPEALRALKKIKGKRGRRPSVLKVRERPTEDIGSEGR